MLSLFYTVTVCFPELWTQSAISFKNRCHRTDTLWSLGFFHYCVVELMIDRFKTCYNTLDCREYTSGMFVSTVAWNLLCWKYSKTTYWVCWPAWWLTSVINFLLHSRDCEVWWYIAVAGIFAIVVMNPVRFRISSPWKRCHGKGEMGRWQRHRSRLIWGYSYGNSIASSSSLL